MFERVLLSAWVPQLARGLRSLRLCTAFWPILQCQPVICPARHLVNDARTALPAVGRFLRPRDRHVHDRSAVWQPGHRPACCHAVERDLDRRRTDVRTMDLGVPGKRGRDRVLRGVSSGKVVIRGQHLRVCSDLFPTADSGSSATSGPSLGNRRRARHASRDDMGRRLSPRALPLGHLSICRTVAGRGRAPPVRRERGTALRRGKLRRVQHLGRADHPGDADCGKVSGSLCATTANSWRRLCSSL